MSGPKPALPADRLAAIKKSWEEARFSIAEVDMTGEEFDAILAMAGALPAARLLRAATEDARMLLSELGTAGMTPNQGIVARQVKTNLDHAIGAAVRAGVERARTIEGDA